MKNSLKVLCVVGLTQLAACSWFFDDHAEDYKHAKESKPLELPKAIDPEDFQEALVIPGSESENQLSLNDKEYEAPRPEPLIIGADNETQSLKSFSNNKLQANLVIDGSGTPTLRLNVDFARAWSEVGQALEKAEYKVTDFNRSIGTYYLEIQENQPKPKEEESCWFFCDDEEEEIDPEAFELKLNRARTGVFVVLHKDADTLAEAEISNKTLNDIKKQLKK